MLIGEPAGLPPVPPYFLMQHLSISWPPEIGNFNINPKNSPRFDLKRQKLAEPKSATLLDRKDYALGGGMNNSNAK